MDEAEKTIFHYTDANGLLGILRKRQIWCSNIVYLNDSQEWLHGVSVFRTMLQELAAEGTTLGGWANLVSGLLNPHDDFLQENAQAPGPQCFVASFSAAEDDLGQWRAYSKPGARFAIGFKRERLAQWAADVHMKLSRLDYDEVKDKSRMRDAFKAALKNPNASPPSWLGISEGFSIAQKVCSLNVPITKHPKFNSEQEWRLASPAWAWAAFPGQGTLEVRPGQGSLIPYYAMTLPPLDEVIESITVGPTRDPAKAKSAVEMALRSLGPDHNQQFLYGKVKVLRSEVPYRDW